MRFFDPDPFDAIYFVKVAAKTFLNLKHINRVTFGKSDEKECCVTLHTGATSMTFHGEAADVLTDRLGLLCDPVFMMAYRRETLKRILKGEPKKRGRKPTEKVKRKVELLANNPAAKVADIMTDEFIEGQISLYQRGGYSDAEAEQMAKADAKDFRREEMNRLRATISDYGLNSTKNKRRKNKKQISARQRPQS